MTAILTAATLIGSIEKRGFTKSTGKHGQSDSEDGGERIYRSKKRSSSSSDQDSSDDDDARRKRHTHSRKHRRPSLATDSSSSPSSGEDDEKRAYPKSPRHHKHNHISGDEDSTSDSEVRKRHSKHKPQLRSSADDSSDYDVHKHNRNFCLGKTSDEEHESGKPRDAKKSHREHGHHHHPHRNDHKHNHDDDLVEPDADRCWEA